MIGLALLLVVQMANAPSWLSQERVDALWEHIQTCAGHREPPPAVYFAADDEPETTSRFMGFYYEHTRVLRVSRAAVRHQLAPLGYVYLVLGHEMLHYALAERVPVPEHHYLFCRERCGERYVEWLIREGVGYPLLRTMPEPDGCGQ